MTSLAVLHVLHDRGGGVDSHVRYLASRAPGRHWLLRVGESGWRLSGPHDETAGGERVRYRWGNPLTRLAHALGAQAIHLHHPVGDAPRVIRALMKTSLPFGVTVHDFYWPCPRIHLVTPEGRYCGAPVNEAACRDCLSQTPSLDLDLRRWRAAHGKLLSRARFVACPSRFVRDVMQQYFPGLALTVAGHGYAPPVSAVVPPGEPALPLLSVAVIGALGMEKGGLRVEQLADITRRRGLPLRWVVIGDTLRHGGPQSLVDGHLLVHGGYSLPQLPGILNDYAVSVAAFPSVGPETWSLTLDEAWACGLPVMVPDLGALGERVSDNGGGWIIRDWERDDAWVDFAASLLSPDGLHRWRTEAEKIRAAETSAPPDSLPVVSLYTGFQG